MMANFSNTCKFMGNLPHTEDDQVSWAQSWRLQSSFES